MSDASSNSDWSPSTDAVAPTDFEACPVLVLHYWAVYDLHDREMDKRLGVLRDEYAGRLCIRSYDTARAENQPFIQGIANLPALACFIRGKWFKSLIGLRSVDELRSVFDDWSTAAVMPANNERRRTGAAGTLTFVRKLLGRGPGR
jgi:hypothetical protein